MRHWIITRDADGFARLTFDKAGATTNTLSADVLAELNEALDELDRDPPKGLAIVSGKANGFIAGADINELAKMTPIVGKFVSEQGQTVFLQIERFPKPVIAAINGFALGGGCELALACHMRIASDKAQLGLPEVSLGIIPGYGGTQRMVRLLGKGKAFELICSGERIGAADAERIGLVNKVVPPDQLMATAEDLAKKIALRSPVAIRAAIEVINSGSDMPFEEGQVLEATLFGLLCASEDMQEGMKAFLEKRTPEFPGR